MKFTAPPLTPERLYLLDKRGKDWNTKERELDRITAEYPRPLPTKEHILSTTEINWGYNCLTDNVHHGRPEALWNIPLLQSLHMFHIDELKEIVVARIYNDAKQFVEEKVAERFTEAWAERVRELAEEQFLVQVARKSTELDQYYHELRWRRDVQGVIERIKLNKLNPHYQPAHSHDSINQLCRMLGMACRYQAEQELK